MKTLEYNKWFRENLVRGEKNIANGIFNYTVGSYSFTTKLTKSDHLSLYDVTNGKVCVATRIYNDYGAIEDSIYVYLYKKLGIVND
jgi:hypothetical protein